ncbi:MAG: HNH endonuclease [Ignavibacteriae bacterium]|nr:HNH endonuclease [Ignavibacteriota bacterium]
MKYELKPDIKNITNEQLIDDLIQVASQLNTDSLTQKDYKKYGKYNFTIFYYRFDGFLNALAKAGLNKSQTKIQIKDDELIEDILRVCKDLQTNSITRDEYNSHGKYHSNTFETRFGSWLKAKELAGLKRREHPSISDEDYFKNLEEVWIKLGRQPHFSDMKIPFSKYSGSGYYHNFGGWRKALESFIEYINKDETSEVTIDSTKDNILNSLLQPIDTPIILRINVKTNIEKPNTNILPKIPKNPIIEHKTKRGVSDRLRYRVMKRDEFKCQLCGRSWSQDNVLEIDHVISWSKGGETTFDNLKTLCYSCNRGKGNLD